jgi:hypothetical protein
MVRAKQLSQCWITLVSFVTLESVLKDRITHSLIYLRPFPRGRFFSSIVSTSGIRLTTQIHACTPYNKDVLYHQRDRR